MATSAATPVPTLPDLRARLPELALRDEHRLRRRLDGLARIRQPAERDGALTAIAADVEAAWRRIGRRRAAVPAITYPAGLPVSERRDEIRAAIRDHQVVIVAGETGSGKTTQLPKICLELGRGVRGMIGHTQPRRLAARTVAERIAEELATPLGGAIGYEVRFTERAREDTLVKLMTDGILLAELQRDRLLHRYDTLIIDEAHERSLNIDFLLGYLHQLLPRRPDLKVVITSATIDPDRFSRHFGDAPVVEVSGRTYPVEIRYRPLVPSIGPDDGASDDRTPDRRVPDDNAGAGGGSAGAEAERDQTQGVVDAVDELCAEGQGDILVFLSGEREIRDTADALAQRDLRDTEIVPLYARLSAAEQHRVFESHPGRRVVLATNVAETSLTVPGIKYVVDPGTARISRYSHRTKVQRLPIEAISQASANQRAGRCGRTSDGICIRLYAEDDFAARPAFTDPEILRTNLASVILQMTAIGLGDVTAFPFIDPPEVRNVRDGVALLHELGAVDPDAADHRRRLTPLGRRLARLPLDPRLARMILEAERNGCVGEVIVIAAALSIQDPRERPAERREAADEQHARFADESSDFLAYLKLWRHLEERQKEFTSSRFRRMCRAEFLNYLRVREWQDLVGQLHQILRGLGGAPEAAAPANEETVSRNIHISLLAGMLSHIGMKDARQRQERTSRDVRNRAEFVGARGARFAVFPGSALAKKPPAWIMAAELVETSRLWARVAARIEPEWAERLGGHLVKRAYSEPHWEKKRAGVVAYEKVTLYGVPLVSARRVDYGPVDPRLARELFIRHALVEGDWQTHHAFFHDNRRLLEEVEELERRARRRGILIDEEALYDFYDQRLDASVVSGRHFDAWWKKTRRQRPDLLTFTAGMLASDAADDADGRAYPDIWEQDGLRLPLAYRFEPGAQDDGVTVRVPLAVLGQVDADDFVRQVPGLREKLVTALIRSLPKQIRRALVPAPDVARSVLERLDPDAEPLFDALEREFTRLAGVPVRREDWQLDRVPDHLRMTFAVVDDEGDVLAEGKDLGELRERFKPASRAALAEAVFDVERGGCTTWSFGTLPHLVEGRHGDNPILAYPALVDEGASVALRLFGNEAEQRLSMWTGTRRLLLLTVPSPVKSVVGRLSNETRLALGHHPHRGIRELFDDCLRCSADHLMAETGGPAWDEDGFARLRTAVAAGLDDTLTHVVTAVARILATAHTIDGRLRTTGSLALVPALTDIRAQLSALVRPGFAAATGLARLPDVHRYLRAIEHRLDRLPNSPQRDRDLMQRVAELRQAYDGARALPSPPDTAAADSHAGAPAWDEVRWMLEELRVSYFAQTLGTPYPVSDKRILRALDQLSTAS